MAKKKNYHYGVYVCPECHKAGGQHADDCTGKMIGAGIENEEEREAVMLAALADE